MGRPRKERPELRKQFGTCSEALSFIEKLQAKHNLTGRLGCHRRGETLIWDWYVKYKEKEKE